MNLKKTLLELAEKKASPCVTISLNTHRTYPDNQQDAIILKNLLKEAESRVEEEYGKRPAQGVLQRIESIATEIDHNHNLDSLHIFLSEDTQVVIPSIWPTPQDVVKVDSTFAIKPLIKALNRTTEYLILTLAQSGPRLYKAINDAITSEVKEEGFPFPENPYATATLDSKDNKSKEYFNQLDKAVVSIYHNTDLEVVVISTEDNYAKLLEEADQPNIYIGHTSKDYNNADLHQIAEQAFEVVKVVKSAERAKAIEEIKEAVPTGKVLTDLQEIYQAAIDGRGELLVVHQDYEQAVKMLDDRTFDLAKDSKEEGVVDDIISTIAWEVFSKKGRVIFTSQDEIKELGKVVLKTRY